MSEELLNRGIQAAQAGEKQRAVELLAKAVRESPDSAKAWFWLGEVLDDVEKKNYCFDKAMKLDRSLFESSNPVQPPEGSESLGEKQVDASAPVPAPVVKPANGSKGGGDPIPVWFWVTGGLAGVAILCVVLVLAVVLLRNAGTLGMKQAPLTPQPTHTQMVWPTLIPSKTPERLVTATLAPSQTPTATIELDATQKFQSLGPQITMASNDRHNSNNQSCIDEYDRLLAEMPDWGRAYFYRGYCERFAAREQNDLTAYIDLLHDAIRDQDRAIEFDRSSPHPYAERGFDYMGLIEISKSTADDNIFLTAAEENLRTAIDLGAADAYPGLYPVYVQVLNQMGHCQKGVTVGIPLLNKDGIYIQDLSNSLSEGYLCLGEYGSAANMAEEAQKFQPTCRGYIDDTEALIGLGELDKALETISTCIEHSPNYGGYRYYLRSYLEYEKGDKDLAREDLDIGSGNTWYHGGLYAYMLARFALDDGDKDTAILSLQYADNSVRLYDGLWLKQRIRREMGALGAPVLPVTPVVTLETTPIGTVPTPTSTLQHPSETPLGLLHPKVITIVP